MQFTIRNIPPELDFALRSKAKEEDKIINQTAIEALLRGFGLGPKVAKSRDVSFLLGTWDSDPEVERALKDQRTIDLELWT